MHSPSGCASCSRPPGPPERLAEPETAIRRAELADVDAMAETAVAAWRVGFRGIVPEHVDPRASWRPERLEERLREPSVESGQILVGEVSGVVRGLVLFGRSRDAGAAPDEGEVIALYVHPDHWRAGLGRRLVAGALERLAEAGLGQAIVWTLAESSRNLAFYESLGFRRDGGEQRRESFGSPAEVRYRMSL
jgi:ribosomal protein S18 acetylase RimI-like enzyme